jgi:ubiquinone/menaquinone biosynthesis C-methylase UbiE
MLNHQEPEFDQYAQEYRDIIDDGLKVTGETSDYYAKIKADNLAAWFPQLVHAPISILDFGCGDGMMTGFVAQTFKNAKVFGVDPSSKSIDIARKNYPHATFDVSDSKIPLPSGQFDLVCAAGVFHHIPFNEHQSYLNEIFRVLKPGGTFVMFELNPLNPGTQFIFNRSPIEHNARMLTPWYAKSLLKPFGTNHAKFYAFFPNFLRWFRFAEPYITKVPFGGLCAYIVKKAN